MFVFSSNQFFEAKKKSAALISFLSKFFRTKIICFGFISSFFHPMTRLKIKITSFCTNKKRCCRKPKTKKNGTGDISTTPEKQKLEHHRTVLRGSEIFFAAKSCRTVATPTPPEKKRRAPIFFFAPKSRVSDETFDRRRRRRRSPTSDRASISRSAATRSAGSWGLEDRSRPAASCPKSVRPSPEVEVRERLTGNCCCSASSRRGCATPVGAASVNRGTRGCGGWDRGVRWGSAPRRCSGCRCWAPTSNWCRLVSRLPMRGRLGFDHKACSSSEIL